MAKQQRFERKSARDLFPDDLLVQTIHTGDKREVVEKLEQNLPDVAAVLNSATFDDQRAAALALKLTDLEDDVRFLRIANGIHNLHYAGTLTRTVVAKLASLCTELEIEPPEIELPKRVAGTESGS